MGLGMLGSMTCGQEAGKAAFPFELEFVSSS
jgi:hypothetical protein